MNKSMKISLHVLFWSIYFLFAAQMSFDLEHGLGKVVAMYREFGLLSAWAAVSFYTMYLRGYKFFERGRYLVYALLCVIIAVANTAFFYPFFSLFLSPGVATFSLSQVVPPLFGTIIIANCGSLLRGFINWIEMANERNELERRSLQHELDSLRSQMNPHFLFNTLNNIDSLIYSSPQKASESLLKLSEILRYMLYNTRETTVMLHEELSHLQNIVELQQLRFGTPGYVKFTHTETNDNICIAPLLFTPFVENAFKYAHNAGKMPVVEIDVRCAGRSVLFTCTNTHNPHKVSHGKEIGGIGLTNVRRRLQLLYPGTHSLQITNENNTFAVTLSIDSSAT